MTGTSKAARFAAVMVTLHAAHNLADHVVQTDRQAELKTGFGPDGEPVPATVGWRAMAGHVGSYHAVQVAALAVADRMLGLGLHPGRVAAAVTFSVATHAFLDRRWPVRRLLQHTGSPAFADLTTPINGPYVADQACHHACLWVAALVAAA